MTCFRCEVMNSLQRWWKSDSEWKWQLIIDSDFQLVLNWEPSDAQAFWQVAIKICEQCPSEWDYLPNLYHLLRNMKKKHVLCTLGSMVFLLLSSQHPVNTDKPLLDLLPEIIDLTKWIATTIFLVEFWIQKVLHIRIEKQYLSCILSVYYKPPSLLHCNYQLMWDYREKWLSFWFLT